MRVLVACEFSGIVREEFRKRGHDAWSCDLLPAEDGSPYHYQRDVIDVLYNTWEDATTSTGIRPVRVKTELLVAFPPCTHLCSSGARWFKNKETEQYDALCFVRRLADCPVPKISIENPIGVLSTRWRKPDQIIQPWMFGHGETKATCLWLKNLPKLTATNIVEGREARVHKASPGPDRWKERSRTLQGIANAMAEQWGKGVYGEATTQQATIY